MTEDDPAIGGPDASTPSWRPSVRRDDEPRSRDSRVGRGDDGDSDVDEGRQTPWYIEMPIIIVIALLISVGVQAFVGRVYLIPSESMQPTLHGCEGCTGDRIWVDKLSYRFSEPEPGDVLVFDGPPSWDDSFVNQHSTNPVINALQTLGSWIGVVAPDENALVKRVIATGGQTVQCREGDAGVMVDGRLVDESYTLAPQQNVVDPTTGSAACGGPYFGPVTIPDDHLWMMGDNRTNSLDSRYHLGDEYQGSVPVDHVVGKVQAIILPFSRIGGVDDPDIQAN